MYVSSFSVSVRDSDAAVSLEARRGTVIVASLGAAAVVALLAILAFQVGGSGGVSSPPSVGSASSSTSASPVPAIKISEPLQGQTVPEDGFAVSGASSLSAADSLWVVYRGLTNGNPSLQPQDEPCVINADGSFNCPREYVGGPTDRGEKFELMFVLADDAAQKVFRDYAASDPPVRGYPGLSSMPSGARKIATTTVIRES